MTHNVVVTGGSRGLGLVIAQKLAAVGATPLIWPAIVILPALIVDRVVVRHRKCPDHRHAIAVVEIARHDRADGIETHAGARQHHQSWPHTRPVDDADANATVDRGGVLTDGPTARRPDGQQHCCDATYASHWRCPEK